MELRGTKVFKAGDLINITYSPIEMSAQKLRLKDVTHHLSTAGWITELDLEEDQKAITTS